MNDVQMNECHSSILELHLSIQYICIVLSTVYNVCCGINECYPKKGLFFMHDTSLLWPIVRGTLYESALPITILLIYALVVGQTTYLMRNDVWQLKNSWK